MWNYKDAPALILALVFVFCAHVGVVAQNTDETTQIRSVTSSFFEAYKRKDVDALIALWSAKAPEKEAFTTEVKQTFSATPSPELKSFDIRSVSVDGTSAIVKVLVESQTTELKRLNRTLRLVKEDGKWKVWQYEPTERELATKLLSAKTEADQKALLEAEPELVTVDLAQALRKNVETLIPRREFPQARIAAQLTRSIAERIGDEPDAAFAISGMGVISLGRGEYQQALEFFEQHLALEVVKRDRAWTARTLNNIGVVHREQGNYARALEYFEKSLALSEAVGDKRLINLGLNNVGTIHGSQGNHAQALEYFQRALKLAQSSDDNPGIANALNNIGLTHYKQHNYPQALDYYQQSLALREKMNDKRGAALTLNNIGLVHREQGNHKKALEYYQQSLAIREKLDDQVGIANVLIHIGFLNYLQGDYKPALEYSNRVIDIATRLSSPELLWRGYEVAGRAYSGLKQFDEAEKALNNSINTIEKMRNLVGGGELTRQRFFEDKLPPYQAMVDLAFSRNRPVDALTYSELAKARTLLDVLRNGRIPINKAMSVEEQEKERTANAELTSLNSEIYDERQRPKPNLDRIAELEPRREKARLNYEAFLTSLYVKHPELKVQRGEAAPITSEEAAALIPDRSTAIAEFVVADDKSYLIVLTSDRTLKIALYPIKITANQLSERVDQFRNMLAGRDLNYQDSARQLYDLLLKPAEEQLRGRKTLCVVPDRSLWELPFQALQPRAGVHLIEDYTLFYAPSLSVLREVTKQPSGPARIKTLLAFGNPQLSGGPGDKTRGPEFEKFGPLPEAEQEVKTLARLYGAGRSRVFIGSEAREGVAKTEASKFEVLHFATHGLLDNRNPMFSFLTMAQRAGDPNEDGLLEAREIINMDLHAKLAVLSACQTARGWVGAGEGVIGMSWALFVAGVPTTVASQWKVDSASTTSLMIDFHRRLTTRSKVTKAEALRQAELGLLRSARYRHPFYWAGFVMIGDGW